MAAILIGLALIAVGIYDYRRHQPPDDAIELPGTVTGVIESRSRLTGRRHVIIYGSDVSYEHPETGRTEQLEPETFGRKRHEMGGSVTVTYNPRTGEGARVGERRWAGMACFPPWPWC